MTVLKELDEAGVFEVTLKENATKARFEESCDSYFSHDLNKDELAELINELQALHDQMQTVA